MQLVKGSIQNVAKNSDVALVVTKAKVVIISDRSSSLLSSDAAFDRPRYEVEDEKIVNLQNKYEGKVLLIGFSDWAEVFLDGVLPQPSGNTNMVAGLEEALPFVQIGLKPILISDGEPTNEESEVISSAKNLGVPLDTIFVGPEGSGGEKFLKRLSKLTKGSSQTCDLKNPALFERHLEHLMLSAGG